jgi:hypothetical protein
MSVRHVAVEVAAKIRVWALLYRAARADALLVHQRGLGRQVTLQCVAKEEALGKNIVLQKIVLPGENRPKISICRQLRTQ